jgi:hypothetical protein
MIYFEYDQWVVDRGYAPAVLCCIQRKSLQDPFNGFNREAKMAERIFEIRDNTVIELKNRTGNFKKSCISSEDKVVLTLKGVLLYRKSKQ